MRPTKNSYTLQSPAQAGAYLKALRKSRGLSQEKVGRLVGVSKARISAIEKDPSALGLTQLLKLLHAMGGRVVLDIDETDERVPKRDLSTGGEW